MKTKLLLQKLSLFLTLSLALAAGGLQTARATTNAWIGVFNTSATTNWSDTANWNPAAGPNGNDLVFGNTGAETTATTVNSGVVTSVVDQNSLNPNSLMFNQNSGSSPNARWHRVLIPSGVSITNVGLLTVGTNAGSANVYNPWVAFVGPGTFVQNSNVTVRTASSSSARLAWLDLSGLSNFVMNASAGTLNVSGSGSDQRPTGQLSLAGGTNILTVGTINVAINGGNIGFTPCSLNLGAGTNILNVGTINVGGGKTGNGAINFSNTTGGLRVRGVTGADSDRNVTMVIGGRTVSGSGSPVGTVDFTGGHVVDVKAGTITVGSATITNATVTSSTGTLQFDAGTVDVTNVLLADNNSATNVNCVGNLIVGTGGKLLVNTLSLVNHNQTAGTNVGNFSFGGTVIVSNRIFKTTTDGTATITMTNGTLTLVSGATVGSSGNGIDNLTMGDSVLNVAPTNSAAIVVTNLTTSGANTINISSLPGIVSYPQQFPIIAYAGTILGSGYNYTLGTLPSGSPAYGGYLSNNVTSLSVDLVLTNGPVLVVGPSGPGSITNSYSGGVLNLSWPSGQGWKLQQQTNALSTGLSTNWVYVTDGSVSSTNITVNPAQPAVFYRLTYP